MPGKAREWVARADRLRRRHRRPLPRRVRLPSRRWSFRFTSDQPTPRHTTAIPAKPRQIQTRRTKPHATFPATPDVTIPQPAPPHRSLPAAPSPDRAASSPAILAAPAVPHHARRPRCNLTFHASPAVPKQPCPTALQPDLTSPAVPYIPGPVSPRHCRANPSCRTKPTRTLNHLAASGLMPTTSLLPRQTVPSRPYSHLTQPRASCRSASRHAPPAPT